MERGIKETQKKKKKTERQPPNIYDFCLIFNDMQKINKSPDDKAGAESYKKGIRFLWIKDPGENPDGFPAHYSSRDGTWCNLVT
jgi:hypothetical protein